MNEFLWRERNPKQLEMPKESSIFIAKNMMKPARFGVKNLVLALAVKKRDLTKQFVLFGKAKVF